MASDVRDAGIKQVETGAAVQDMAASGSAFSAYVFGKPADAVLAKNDPASDSWKRPDARESLPEKSRLMLVDK